jgi:hypothetical protein
VLIRDGVAELGQVDLKLVYLGEEDDLAAAGVAKRHVPVGEGWGAGDGRPREELVELGEEGDEVIGEGGDEDDVAEEGEERLADRLVELIPS